MGNMRETAKKNDSLFISERSRLLHAHEVVGTLLTWPCAPGFAGEGKGQVQQLPRDKETDFLT